MVNNIYTKLLNFGVFRSLFGRETEPSQFHCSRYPGFPGIKLETRVASLGFCFPKTTGGLRSDNDSSLSAFDGNLCLISFKISTIKFRHRVCHQCARLRSDSAITIWNSIPKLTAVRGRWLNWHRCHTLKVKPVCWECCRSCDAMQNAVIGYNCKIVVWARKGATLIRLEYPNFEVCSVTGVSMGTVKGDDCTCLLIRR